MSTRTDLALENKEQINREIDGVECDIVSFDSVKITRLNISTEAAAKEMEKPIGNYITIEVPPFSDDATPEDSLINVIKTELTRLIPKDGAVLVIGLGNTSITPDAFGPKAAAGVLATRHITGEIARSVGLGDLRGVAVLSPGVLGQTGIETVEIIKGLVDKISPSCVICIDALASMRLSRLGCTVQMSDAGISPGAGVGNRRMKISQDTLNVPVIAIGVPTVVDAVTLANDLTGSDCLSTVEPRGLQMIVTPQEVDLIVDRAAKVVSLSVNKALQPHLDTSLILELV